MSKLRSTSKRRLGLCKKMAAIGSSDPFIEYRQPFTIEAKVLRRSQWLSLGVELSDLGSRGVVSAPALAH